MSELREHERKTLAALAKLDGRASVEKVVEKGGLSDAAVMRAAVALQEKKLVEITESKRTTTKLTTEGKSYVEKGLPERRMIKALKELGGKASIGRIIAEAKLENWVVPIALGWIQRKKWATLNPQTKMLHISENIEKSDDEKLLELLGKRNQASVEDLIPELQKTVQTLKGRKLIDVEEKTYRILEMTENGQAIIRRKTDVSTEVTQLTPELIITGKWKKTKLQKYNIEASVANTWPGKKHPYLLFIDQVKEKLGNLGFKEMSGPTVETSFFNFDALYTPQDHPAREAFGIYYVKRPKYGRIDVSKRILENVRRTHEDGWKTDSTGWKYRYSRKEATRLILRGHGTCQSARTMLSKDLEVPGRYFSVVRCYRPEFVDRTHLTEFNQVEGIVADENLTLRDLLGVLGKFAVEIAGADEVRFRPDYFPFTEPSVELDAYKKGYGWVEFGGSGIFRPEVTLPLEIKVPIIAWGLGIDRLYMLKARIEDIREIFSQNLDWIRKKSVT